MSPAITLGQLTAWAQIAVAAGTVILAFFTWRLARETRSVVTKADDELSQGRELLEATRLQATASQALAEEARRDRELTWRPQLSLVRFEYGSDRSGTLRATVEVMNAGAGPALGCRIFARLPTDRKVWWLIRASDLGGLQSRERSAPLEATVPLPLHLFAPPVTAEDQFHRCDLVMFCSDVLGRRHRFPVIRAADDQLLAYPAETWASGDAYTPAWATQPGIWSI